jgi:hypothetical protein
MGEKKSCAAYFVSHMKCFISLRFAAFDLFSRRIWKNVSSQTFDTKYETIHLTVEFKPHCNSTCRRRRHHHHHSTIIIVHIAQVTYAVMVLRINEDCFPKY